MVHLPAVTPTLVRRLTVANLIANIGIVITGGAVRLTGSGLGCPTFPLCTPDSFVPTPALEINGVIEFVNRTLTGVIVIIAALTYIAIRRLTPARRDLQRPAFFVLLGIPVQAILGGITVLTGLNPWTVMSHFLISMVLVALATVTWLRARSDAPSAPTVDSPLLRGFGFALLSVVFITLALGTVVTGTGPHGGDPEAGRTGFDVAFVTQLHADAVYALVGMTLALVVLVAALKASRRARLAAYWLLAIVFAQGTLGYVQYFNGLPEIVVGFHMLGAALTTAATAAVVLSLQEDPVPDSAAGAADTADERTADLPARR